MSTTATSPATEVDQWLSSFDEALSAGDAAAAAVGAEQTLWPELEAPGLLGGQFGGDVVRGADHAADGSPRHRQISDASVFWASPAWSARRRR